MVNNVRVLNIRECLVHDSGDVLGEDEIQNILSDFYCELNPDVERFLKEQSIEFTKKQQSVTYVILDEDTASSLGYFTLAIKPLSVTLDDFSNTMKKRIARVSKVDKNTGKYTFSAYLIAQLARNFSPRLKRSFSGQDVLEVAIKQIKEIQYMAGGMVYFLEAENHPKLLKFYEDNGFKRFATKDVERSDGEQHTLVQLLKIL